MIVAADRAFPAAVAKLASFGGITRMKTSQPLIAFVVLLVVHSLVSLAAYRFLATTTRTPLPVNSTPVETTTAQERAQGKSSFRIMTGSEMVARKIPYSVGLYVIFGYAALAVALVLALIARFRPPTT